MIGDEGWFKSSHSTGTARCVQARFLAAGGVAIRHSADDRSAVLRYTQAEWDAFVQGVKDGEFDGPR
ncbi:uncharacterized protein DUF397 [Actinoplanes italicus]|uniref:Uncharacterized protein DUF397 n=1 Tax=Actinoplanes italicus TaxID=113567 RepID=A0A2T0JX71_9ACTN|nr:DUF397 domain-containing protein [Actinoplanes italicus]PRX12598.1 uncharacterized protein DUF397 [Actinoplanes italicus]